MTSTAERGVAIVVAMFMTLLVSALAASMAFMARTETLSSHSYTTMAQARYAAESGLAAAANYLLSTPYQTVAPGSAADPLTNYDMTLSPVRRVGTGTTPAGCGAAANCIVLSTVSGGSNYPFADVVQAFATAASGTLNVGSAAVQYNARARLLTMRQLIDPFSGLPRVLQTWEITGIGRLGGSGAAEVEVTAIIERQPVPAYRYAAFATFDGCDALSFAGGASTRSYDSQNLVGGNPNSSDTGGNVGTNGGLSTNGGPTVIHGALSTPRQGVGACTANNVTAATVSAFADVDELITLPQPVEYPTPEPMNPLPPTTDTSFNSNGCPSTNPPLYCTPSTGGATITPPSSTSVVRMGNVSVEGNKELRLHAGIYELNSLSLAGNGTITVASGPVIIKIAGQGESTPLDLAGGGVSNPTYNPTNLQFIYGGTGNIKVTGGSDTAALVYAPNASASLHGATTEFYGALITKYVTATGGFTLHYDRALQKTMVTAGNPVMSSFTWRSF
jgi:hypothetical protein